MKKMWANGANYESYIGRWSRLISKEFLAWLDISPDSNWSDVGWGTGVLSQSIINTTSPKNVIGIDPSEKFIEFARTNIRVQVLQILTSTHQ